MTAPAKRRAFPARSSLFPEHSGLIYSADVPRVAGRILRRAGNAAAARRGDELRV